MLQNILHKLPDIYAVYPTNSALAGGTLCAIASAEMAIWAVGNLILNSKEEGGSFSDSIRRDFSANLGGAIFYGLCAFNLFPGSAALGGAIFTMYSATKTNKTGEYLSTRAISQIVTIAFSLIKPIWNVAADMIQSLCRHVVFPIANALVQIASQLFRMPLVQQPAWIGVALLLVAIAVRRGSGFPFKAHPIPVKAAV